jgi:hypothetical protein
LDEKESERLCDATQIPNHPYFDLYSWSEAPINLDVATYVCARSLAD